MYTDNNTIKIKNTSSNPNPFRQTEGSSGYDIYSNETIVVIPGESSLIKTGLFITEMSNHLEMQIRSRSGLALKNGIMVLNSPATIDSDYRGDIGVVLYNTSNIPFKVNVGDRIAQFVIANVVTSPIAFVTEDGEVLSSTGTNTRDTGGFGSTGV